MSAKSNAQRLVAAAGPVESHALRERHVSVREYAETCPLCFGTGMEVIAGKGARRCGCRTNVSGNKLLEAARLPPRYSACSLSNYRPASDSPSQLRAFNYACRLVSDYPAIDRGMLLTGPCGVGKTHLAAAVIRALMERGVPCLFYESGALLREIQDTYQELSQTSERSVLEPVLRAEVLVLDELGAARPTEWVLDTMMQIINSRYNDRKLTILTTNYPDEGRAEGCETLADRIGVRLRSRLYEMCRTVVIDGEDYRKSFDK